MIKSNTYHLKLQSQTITFYRN